MGTMVKTETNQGSLPAGSAPGAGAIEPLKVRDLLAGGAVLVDVREPDEYARERIDGARLMPLGRLTPEAVVAASAGPLIVHCKSGRRSEEAVARLRGWGFDAVSMRGGIEAWKAAGLPVTFNASAPIPIMRQVQIVVGAMVLIGTALSWWVSPLFLIVPAFFGAGLLFAGVSGLCGLAAVLGWMPWNRVLRTAAACPPGHMNSPGTTKA